MEKGAAPNASRLICYLHVDKYSLAHSFIFNAQDNEWLEYFTEEEIAEIKDQNSVDVYAKVTNESFPLESDCKWAQDSIYQAFRLLLCFGFLNVKNVTEGGLIKRVMELHPLLF